MSEDGALVVDPFLNTNVKDVYAAGDLCEFPYWPTGRNTRVEHFNVALDQGTFAAYNMMGKMQPFSKIPFYWTRMYGQINVAGNTQGYTTRHIEGDVNSGKFIVYYIASNDQVLAAAGMGRNQDISIILEALQQNKMPNGSSLKSGAASIESIKKDLKLNVGAGKCRREHCC